MKTYMAKKGQVEAKWWVVDAKGKTLGRLASHIARVLMGKHRPTYTPHMDTGDFVIVLNAGAVRVTGRKMDQKEYTRFTGYPGGLRRTPLRTVLAKHPEDVIRHAVKRMMPKGSLGNAMLSKLKVYAAAEHPHAAQAPEPMVLPTLGKRI